MMIVTMILATFSANVFPRHTLLPAKKGAKLNGFLFLPSGVR